MRLSRVFVVAGLLLLAVGVSQLLWSRQDGPGAEPPPATLEPVKSPPPAAAAVPAPATAPPATAPPAPRAAAPTEAAEMEKIRRIVKSEPGKALDLIATASATHGETAFTEERASLRIDALVYTGEVGRARDHAEDYLRRYPAGAFAEHIERLTGVHPRPPMPGEDERAGERAR